MGLPKKQVLLPLKIAITLIVPQTWLCLMISRKLSPELRKSTAFGISYPPWFGPCTHWLSVSSVKYRRLEGNKWSGILCKLWPSEIFPSHWLLHLYHCTSVIPLINPFPHFTDEKTESQKEGGVCPRWREALVVGLGCMLCWAKAPSSESQLCHFPSEWLCTRHIISLSLLHPLWNGDNIDCLPSGIIVKTK